MLVSTPVPTRYDQRPDLAAGQIEALSKDLAILLCRERQRSRELEAAVGCLREARRQFAYAFALLVEGNDTATRAHLDRTCRWATAISEALGLEDLDVLQLGFLLHDVGKWGVPKEIVQKPGPLGADEWRQMKTHPLIGAQMVADVVPPPAVDVIRYHHERWDGRGYPFGLAGEQIPLGARVFAVADAFDALTWDRPYRAAVPLDQAVVIIWSQRGRQFDPVVVDAFVELYERLQPAKAAQAQEPDDWEADGRFRPGT